MKKLALGALFGFLAACGGGKKDVTLVDAPDGVDGDVSSVCNPIAQTGCNANEKCTWIIDQDTPTEVGHIGCVVLTGAEVAVGGACTVGPAGPQGFDDCEKGSVCVAAECKTICDPMQAGVASGCDAQHSCSRYSGLFEVAGTITAGACDPGCDPLTQRLLVGNTEACGATNPAMPNKGCYTFDFESFSCAPVGMATLGKTDRVEPVLSPSGNPFVNGCAPGYVPFFFEDDSGAMKTLCSGLCASGEISNQNGQAANKPGRSAVSAKLVDQPAPRVGDGTCAAAKKGSVSGGDEYCVMLWTFLATADQATMTLIPGPSDFNYKLGVCFAYTNFHFDHDNDPNTPEQVLPNPATLPKSDPNVIGGGAEDWGTQCPSAPAADNTKCIADTTATAAPASNPERPNHVNPKMRDFHVGFESKESALFQHSFR